MKKTLKIICGLMIVTVMLAGLSACGGVPEPDYAEPITEELLQAMEAEDYAGYTGHFNEEMLQAVTEPVFMEVITTIKAAIGSYQSKEFWKTVDEGAYKSVYYRAKFSQETENVIVRVVFQEIDSEVSIAGIWFDSPMLRGQ